MKLNKGMGGIKVEGYRGTWYVICETLVKDSKGRELTMFTLEHETYGDEAAPCFVDKNGKSLNLDSSGYLDPSDIISDMKNMTWEEADVDYNKHI